MKLDDLLSAAGGFYGWYPQPELLRRCTAFARRLGLDLCGLAGWHAAVSLKHGVPVQGLAHWCSEYETELQSLIDTGALTARPHEPASFFGALDLALDIANRGCPLDGLRFTTHFVYLYAYMTTCLARRASAPAN